MVFEFDLTVPANTPETAKISKTLKLTYGIIHQLEVIFPTGCAGLVKCHINDALHQVWPTNPDGVFKGDGNPIIGRVFHEMDKEPFELQLWAWNEDDTYNHTITVRLWLLKPWQLFVFSEQMWRRQGL
ncbi:MAG: hypothetical protein DRP09_20365 [Candidatus Thorarchaeota archaeon]|nr:MAG: hypothetical protein DRP09_20365 [Candidatus Thorarchaeota archaeon]